MTDQKKEWVKPWWWLICFTRPVETSEERGASMVEYALLVVLIAIVVIAAATFTGSEVSQVFSEVGSELDR